MRVSNWIKKNWTDPVWSKVFAGIILAIILAIVPQLLNWINQIILFDKVSKLISNFSNWVSEDSQVSNLTLLLVLVFIGIVITVSIYNLLTKKWLGKTERFYASDTSFTVRGTYSVNLDLGIQAKGSKDADFWWRQKTKTERSLVPLNGAQFCIIGPTSQAKLSKEELEKLVYSADEILADDNHSNRIPKGTVIAYRTKNRRVGTMKILEYGYNLEIEFYTLKLENE